MLGTLSSGEPKTNYAPKTLANIKKRDKDSKS